MLAIAPCQISLMLATALHPPRATHCPMRSLMLAIAPCQMSLMLAIALHPPPASRCPCAVSC